MQRRRIGIGMIGTALVAMLAGCPGPAAPDDGGTGEKRTTAGVNATPPRKLAMLVRGPEALATGGKLLSDAMAGTIQPGGTILSEAMAGAVAKTYRLTARSGEALVPVGKARVQLWTLAGKAVGEPVTADAKGQLTLPAPPDYEILTAVANFQVAGKPYRLATLVAPGTPPKTLAADPIQTMIEARMRDVLGPKRQAKALTFDRLADVYEVCDKNGVEIAPDALRADRELDVVTKDLNEVWTMEIDAKVKDAAEKATIKTFVADVKAAVQ